jgi:hypothetical protein
MAYNVYILCDRCGDDGLSWTNQTVPITGAMRIARKRGWKIGMNGWICPECQKKNKSNHIAHQGQEDTSHE